MFLPLQKITDQIHIFYKKFYELSRYNTRSKNFPTCDIKKSNNPTAKFISPLEHIVTNEMVLVAQLLGALRNLS